MLRLIRLSSSSIPRRSLQRVAGRQDYAVRARSYASRHTKHLGLACTGSAVAILSVADNQTKCDVAVVERKEKRSSSRQKKRRARRFMRRLRRKIVAWIEMMIRSIYLSLVFAPAALTLPVALLQGIDQDGVDDKRKASWWWSILRNCIRNSGPCTIKFSQWIATRPDLFPLSLCTQLQDLQINATRHEVSESLKSLKRAPGVSTLFANKSLVLDQDQDGQYIILGSGCIAQVFKGNLSRGKEEKRREKVAVKIVHPFAAKSIHSDTNIMLGLTWLIEALPGTESLSLHESVKEFTALMLSQLDLQREADSLHVFRQNFAVVDSDGDVTAKNKNRDSVRFPTPIASSKNVLVESLEDGYTFAEVMSYIEKDPQMRSELAKALLDTVLKMTFEDNYIHADLHSGNIIVRGILKDGESGGGGGGGGRVRGSSEKEELGLSIIDTGLVASLNGDDRRNFIDLFSAVVRNRGKEAGNLMVERNRHPANASMSEQTKERFAAEIACVVAEVHDSGLSLGRIGVAALLQKVLVACYKHQVKLESKFVSTVLAIGVVEGLGRRLDPDVDVLKRAAPYIFKATLKSH